MFSLSFVRFSHDCVCCKIEHLITFVKYWWDETPNKVNMIFVLARKVSWKISEFFAKTLSGLKKWNCTWIYEEWKKKFWPFRDCFRSLLQASRLELASLVVLHSVPRYHVSVFSKKFLLSTAHWSGIKIVFWKRLESAKLTKSMVFKQALNNLVQI